MGRRRRSLLNRPGPATSAPESVAIDVGEPAGSAEVDPAPAEGSPGEGPGGEGEGVDGGSAPEVAAVPEAPIALDPTSGEASLSPAPEGAAEASAEAAPRRRRARPPMAFVPRRKMFDGWRPRKRLPPKMRVKMQQVAHHVGLRPHEFRMAGALMGLAVAMMVTGAVGLLLVRFLLM